MKFIKPVLDKLDDAAFLRAFHGIMTILWGLLVPITVFTGLKGSIVWIAMMSVWANFVGHFSSWQASRAEVKIDAQDKTARLK
jgi:hypothetical protein